MRLWRETYIAVLRNKIDKMSLPGAQIDAGYAANIAITSFDRTFGMIDDEG